MFKKRTKLLGATSKQALSILDDLCQEKFQRKLSPGVHDAALICYKCRMKVEGLPDLYKKAEAARGDLLELIENVLRGCENLPQPQDIQSDTDTQCTAEELDEEELLPPSAKSRRRDSVDLLEHNDTSCTPVRITVPFRSRKQTFTVTSPWSKQNVKRLARKNLSSLVSSFADSPRTSNLVLKRVSFIIHKEMTDICSLHHNSVLRDGDDGVKYFNWDTVWVELAQKMPTLMKLLYTIITQRNGKKKKILTCLIACMILKGRNKQMALLQRVISVLLYGNGCIKQVQYSVAHHTLRMLAIVDYRMPSTFPDLPLTFVHSQIGRPSI
jgi:hypothetical protein